MSKPLSIVGISGSLRKESYNTGLLKAAQEFAPKDVTIEILEIGNLPLFNQELEKNLPAEVQALKAKVEAADAVLFAVPEYNYSMTGVLKNAIDWLSRPYGKNSLDGKPAAIMSASVGNGAGAKAQYHLRQSFVFLNVHAVNRPEVMVPIAQDKFDAEGKIKDDHTREKVKELLAALIAWTQQLQK
jgi:chromate reductase